MWSDPTPPQGKQCMRSAPAPGGYFQSGNSVHKTIRFALSVGKNFDGHSLFGPISCHWFLIWGEILRKWKIPLTGFYYGLLRILRDFPKGFYWLWIKTPKKTSKLSHLRKPWKNWADLLWILRKSQLRNITEYYGILRNITDITEYKGYYGI